MATKILFGNIEAVGAHLHRLSLTFNGRMGEDVSTIIQTCAHATPIGTILAPSSKELSIANLDLNNMFSSVSLVANMLSLTHLSLMECTRSEDFMDALGVYAGAERLSLEHLAVNNLRSYRDKATHTVFRSHDIKCEMVPALSQSLHSLHIGADQDSGNSPATTLRYIKASGRALASLSFYCEDD